MNQDKQQDVLKQLDKICRDKSQARHGERLKRALLAVAIPASASFAIACYAATEGEADWIYDPTDEICTDALDNDYNGLADCDDPACSDLEICLGCGDGIDNDENGTADCLDISCRASEGCITGLCDDDEDNDNDGLADCMDPDCEGDQACQ